MSESRSGTKTSLLNFQFTVLCSGSLLGKAFQLTEHSEMKNLTGLPRAWRTAGAGPHTTLALTKAAA